MPLALLVPSLVVYVAALALALAALERFGEVGLAIVVADTLDLPELPSCPLFPLLLVVVLAHMDMRSVYGPSAHSCNIASTLQQVLALAPV